MTAKNKVALAVELSMYNPPIKHVVVHVRLQHKREYLLLAIAEAAPFSNIHRFEQKVRIIVSSS